MRHRKSFNHLGRQVGHRKAMLANMASSLILHKRINTTVAKAKALRQFVEPIISKGKVDSTHSRRMAFSYLRDKYAVTELFGDVASKVGDRPGGYTRIIKMNNRLGDNAAMAIIELVDFNDMIVKEAKSGTAKKKRSRRGAAKKADPAAAAAPAAEETLVEAAPEVKAEAPAPVAEEAKPEVKAEAPAAEAPTKEEKKEEAKADEAKAPEAKAEEKKEDNKDEDKK
ncbi:MAG: large subunit ribosomal protein L17 [Bacteroidia bacterium]|jgi:large subunit ribosomal protein L17